ncbi:TetR/AcrR family transcriptional regulator [Streptomyces sp. NPDC092359]|uniref:TetR/AcrR family transcriptional regulator n=1 Tax=Streptomyces sp. NPDC092359 TaxID=3366014 RepID=UPI0038132A1B
MARSALTRDEVLDTAAALVREHGPDALTMRRLAAALSTAVTSIYWHVGNRESLLDALVARTVADLGTIRPRGGTPAERIVSVARALRRALLERPHLVAMVHERGLTERMFLPSRRALVHEVHAAGLRGARAAGAVRAVQFQVVGYVLVERARERAPVQEPGEEPGEEPGKKPGEEPGGAPGGDEPWDVGGVESDGPLARALAAPVDTERLFVDAVRALVDGLLRGAAGGTGDGGVGGGPYSQ